MTKHTVRIGSVKLHLFRKGNQFLREKCLYMKRSGIGCKKFQRVHTEPFLTSFQCFEEFQYRSNFYFLWPNLPSKLAKMNCAPLKGKPVSYKKVSLPETIWYGLQEVPKSAPRTISDIFSALWGIVLLVKLLLLITEPTVRIGSSERCLLWKGDTILIKKGLYLKRSGIGCKRFQRVNSEPFSTKFQFFEEF